MVNSDDLDHDEPKFRNRDDVVSVELGVSRRKLMKQFSALGITGGLASMAGCSDMRQGGSEEGSSTEDTSGASGGTEESSGGSEGGSIPNFQLVDFTPSPTRGEEDYTAPSNQQRRMDFVIHDASIEIWMVTVSGMNDALNQLGWTGEFIGPTSNDETSQLEILNTKISQLEGGRDAIATSVLDEQSYVDPINRALEKGIPVVNYNTTVSSWDYDFMMENFGTTVPYVGQQDFPAGNAVGSMAVERAKQQIDADQYTLLPCIEVPGHPALQTRIEGVVNYVEQQENFTALDNLDITTDVSEATSRITDAYRSNPDINIIIGTFSPGVAGGARVASNEGIVDEMIVGGWDVTPLTIEAFNQGTADFTVDQDPYSQGFMPPHLVFKYMDRGVPMKDYPTGVAPVTENNYEYANQLTDELRELQRWQQDNYENPESYGL